jgi:hypothetical protein
MIINFRACGISRGARKLVWTLDIHVNLKKKKKNTPEREKKLENLFRSRSWFKTKHFIQISSSGYEQDKSPNWAPFPACV